MTSSLVGRLGALPAWFRILIVAVASLSIWLSIEGLQRSVQITPELVTKDQGFAFIASGINPIWPLVVASDSSNNGARSSLRLYENDKELGPPHTLHAAIRERGSGAYSHWNGELYFSASDNSDPVSNHRRYVAVERIFPSSVVVIPLLLMAGAIVGETLVRLSSRYRATFLPLYRALHIRWIWQNVVPGVVVAAAILVVLAAGGEAYLRFTLPFTSTAWPSLFRPDVGFTFEPHATVRWTNSVDYWMEERTNRDGFLDREFPSGPPGPGVCRVVFIGDSFVEAAQVPIKDKFHILFESEFNERSHDRKVDTVAIGYSGTGQLNQLPFYTVFARPLRPNVVVLIIVGNDLANNSALLESIRNGWHPVYSPRLYAKRKPRSGEIEFQNIAADWQDHVLPIATRESEGRNAWHRFLISHSMLYDWLFKLLSGRFPGAADLISGEPSYGELIFARISYLKHAKDTAPLMEGWDDSTFGDLDGDFFRPGPLAPAFQEAIAFSDFTLAKWVEETHRDGVKLLAMTTQSLASGDQPGPYLERVRDLLKKNGIDEIDQLLYAKKMGHAEADSRWSRDGHWNKNGHQWVADQMSEYFTQHPDLCK